MVNAYDPLDAQIDNLALDADRLRKQLFRLKRAVISYYEQENAKKQREIDFLREVYGDEVLGTALKFLEVEVKP